jgi:hypothetical protein
MVGCSGASEDLVPADVLVIRAGCAGVPRGSGEDAELLVLRHENAVLRREAGRVLYKPADRAWFAALAPFVRRRRWAGVFPVTPATLLIWHRRLAARKYDTSTRRRPGRPKVVRGTARVAARTCFCAMVPAPAGQDLGRPATQPGRAGNEPDASYPAQMLDAPARDSRSSPGAESLVFCVHAGRAAISERVRPIPSADSAATRMAPAISTSPACRPPVNPGNGQLPAVSGRRSTGQLHDLADLQARAHLRGRASLRYCKRSLVVLSSSLAPESPRSPGKFGGRVLEPRELMTGTGR